MNDVVNKVKAQVAVAKTLHAQLNKLEQEISAFLTDEAILEYWKLFHYGPVNNQPQPSHFPHSSVHILLDEEPENGVDGIVCTVEVCWGDGDDIKHTVVVPYRWVTDQEAVKAQLLKKHADHEREKENKRRHDLIAKRDELDTVIKKMAKPIKIIPVHEPNGEGNGWDKCEESQAKAFEVDNGYEVIECFDTRSDAEAFVKTGCKHGENCGCKTCQQYVS